MVSAPRVGDHHERACLSVGGNAGRLGELPIAGSGRSKPTIRHAHAQLHDAPVPGVNDEDFLATDGERNAGGPVELPLAGPRFTERRYAKPIDAGLTGRAAGNPDGPLLHATH